MSHGSVVVAGAGIGGLAAGIGLRRVGFDVRIVERRPQPGVVGAGIALFPNVMRAFDALGVGDAVRAVSARPLQSTAGSGLRLPSGRWLLRTTDPRTADLLACHRNDLYRVLVEALPAEVVEPATEVVDVVPDAAGHGVRVVLHHGGHEGGRDHASGAVDADLLVGADGIDSIVRGRCRPGAALRRLHGLARNHLDR